MKKVLLIAAAALAFTTCSTLSNIVSEPQVAFDKVSLKKISFDGVDLVAHLNVANSNSFTIPFPRIDWNLFVADSAFVNGVISNDTKLAANSTTPVEVPFNVPYKGLYETITNLLDADEAPYKLATDVTFDIPVIGQKTLSHDFTGSLPMLKAPDVSFGGVKVNSLSLTKAELTASWAIENKNAFPISLDNLAYNLAINGTQWASGSAPQKLSMAARKTTQIPVTVSVSAVSLVTQIAALVAAGKQVNFTSGGEASLRPDFEGVDAFNLPFDLKGLTSLKK
jgi:LEA14-like dessication related protein